jgi:pimeloyl-ACP methyl ester carboxylesterase
VSFTEKTRSKLHYQVLGKSGGKDEPTVVFLHGLVMDNLSSWFFTMANAVSRRSRVLLYDLRGHGFSDRPREGYSVETHVEDLRELLAEAGAEGPVVLVGNSFGGLLALNFAHRYPEFVRGLVLVDAQLNDDAWKAQMARSLGLQGEERDKLIGATFQNWLGRNSKRKSNRLAENAEDLVVRTSLMDDLRASANLEDPALRRISVPALGIYGASSDIIHVAHRLKGLLPDFELQVLEGCTHSVIWEKTEAVKSLITGWLARFQGAPREERT